MFIVLVCALLASLCLVALGFAAYWNPGPPIPQKGAHRASKEKPPTQHPAPIHSLYPMGPRRPDSLWAGADRYSGEHRSEDTDPPEESEVYPR